MKSAMTWKSNRLGYLMLIPSLILFGFVTIYPLINGMYLSFTDYSTARPGSGNFIGLTNYITILTTDKEFLGVLEFSAISTASIVILSYLTGLVIALALRKTSKLNNVLRAIFIIPWMIPTVVLMTNWTWVLNDRLGVVNNFLKDIGLIERSILFLATPQLARMTVVMVGVWQTFPFMLIVILAGLQSIPNDLYESATIDGANWFRRQWYITFPMIKNISLVCSILLFIWTFNNMERIWLLTQGGPINKTFVLPILIYYTSFYRFEMGYASAISVIMLIVLILFTSVYLRRRHKEEM